MRPGEASAEVVVERLRHALGYFSCPVCCCAWFRSVGEPHNVIQCKHCGLKMNREKGETSRFFDKEVRVVP